MVQESRRRVFADNHRPLVLIVEDEEITAELYASMLEESGYSQIQICTDSRQVLPSLATSRTSIILLDLNMPHTSGKELLERISVDYPEIPVIILTAEDKVDTAVECMKIGAFDFMAKPVDSNRLVNAVNHAVRFRELQTEVEILAAGGKKSLKNPDVFKEIVTENSEMHRIFAYIEAIAGSPKAVLITGESGTGKELIAKAVHRASGASGLFVPVNVSGLDDTILSDTLFGHRRGAFTGADTNRKGLIEKAAGGTLFLDEIGDLPVGAQIKLLRLLQEGEYYPLGADSPERSSARIIAATNADLQNKQSEGSFRKDLYYRLISHHIQLPPLRRRRDDIPLLINHFVEDTIKTLGLPRPTVPGSVFKFLERYGFPGNVRELQSMIFDVVSRYPDSTLQLQAFRSYIGQSYSDDDDSSEDDSRYEEGLISFSGQFPTLREVEEFFIAEALERSGGNQSEAARLLGVSQSTLSRRVRGVGKKPGS